MKTRFYAYEDYPVGTTSDPYGRCVKKFKHQNEAINFVEDDKNLQQYNGLSLYTFAADNTAFRYIGAGQWEIVK